MPSGAVLKISPAPFADSKALFKALLKEARGLEISTKMELPNLLKNLFCTGYSSDEIEERLKVCLSRCTYNDGKGDLKIDDDTFNPVKNREDYLYVYMEVAQENVGPFMKSLYAEFQRYLATLEATPA